MIILTVGSKLSSSAGKAIFILCLITTLLPVKAFAWFEKIGDKNVLVVFKDGDLAYYDMGLKLGDNDRPTITERYRLCPSEKEAEAGFPEIYHDQYPGGDHNGLCILVAYSSKGGSPYDLAKKEIARISEENKLNLPEKRLNEKAQFALAMSAVIRFNVCPSGTQPNPRLSTDYSGVGFYLKDVTCQRPAVCREGFIRSQAVPRDGGTSECRRYGECPSETPIRVGLDKCGACTDGGCIDLSRKLPMCVINMKNPKDLSHCKK